MKRACRPSPAWPRWAFVVCVLAAWFGVCPATAQDCARPSFATLLSTTSTDAPYAVVEGDFDGDGDLDVVVARDGTTASVAFYRGDGGGLLSFQSAYDVGSGPRDVVAADFDRDGVLDIAVASETAGTVSALRGLEGTFSTAIPKAVGGSPVRLAVADFNLDGRPDLVVVRSSPAGIRILLGNGDLTFTAYPNDTLPEDRSLAGANAAVAGDFNGDGKPDVAVSQGSADQVSVFLGRGDGFLGDGEPSWNASPLPPFPVGDQPVDIATADVDSDGDLDLVTANRLSGGTVTLLRGDGEGSFPAVDTEVVDPTGLVDPVRVALADVDRDGHLDLAALDAGALPPRIAIVLGTGTTPPPAFQSSAFPAGLPPGSVPQDMATGDVAANGRVDFIVVDQGSTNFVSVYPNQSGPECPRASFGDAPRAFPGGDSPWALTVADFDEDGIEDLVAAHAGVAELSLLRGSGNGYQAPTPLTGLVVRARGLGTADFDFDGHADVVAALGNGSDGRVQLLEGSGMGDLTSTIALADGVSMTAVVVGDFNGDGGPDIAATSDETDQLFVFLGDGTGVFTAAPASPMTLGADPWALAAGYIDGDLVLDLAVAHYSSNNVSILLGDGDGTFTSQSDVPVGAAPWSVALGDVDGDTNTDLVTANFTAEDVSIALGNGNGGFGGLETWFTASPQDARITPIAVSVLDVVGGANPDVLVALANHTLAVLEGPYEGAGVFASEDFVAVRQRPSQMVPVDADGDGRKDLAIPCKDSGDVVVLLARSPGPPAFLEAGTIPVGAAPVAATAGDFDRDGDVDLAVVSRDGDSMTILRNDGAGGFTPSAQSPISIGASPMAIVATDLNLDGVLDLAVSCAGSNQVQFFEGDGALGFPPAPTTQALSVPQPDDLVAGDFDRDGDPDLAVLSKSGGSVHVILNARLWDLSLSGLGPYTVGTSPTAVVASDFTGDGILDLVVANDDSDDLSVLVGETGGNFAAPSLLQLGGGTSPLSVTGGDFDDDGDVDLATVVFGGHRLLIFRNTGTGLPTTPTLTLEAPREPSFVTTSDFNRDGITDLALAAFGLKIVRGGAGLAFEAGEDFLAGITPLAVVPADYNRDGLPDVAVVNNGSDDVSIVLSTACMRRRLVVSTSPAACTPGPSPFPVQAVLEVQDDGGNLLTCESGTVNATLAAGGGSLGGTTSVGVSDGIADFDALSIDPGGVRYQLQFDLPGVPTVLSRTFSLDPLVQILGPTSVCPASAETYTANQGLDSYYWTLSPAGPGFPNFNPTTTLTHDDLAPETPYTLGLQGRVDGCAPSDTLDVYVGNLYTVNISSPGPFSACVDCFGGTFTATETGGGVPTARQWGYRTDPGGDVMAIPDETGPTYVFKGTDFPGPGTYYLVETTTPAAGCGGSVVSNEIAVDVRADVPGGEVQSLGVLSRGSTGVGENVLQWVNPSGLDHVLIRWNKAATGTSSCTSPTTPTEDGDDVADPIDPIDYGGFPPTRDSYAHGGLEGDTAYCYSVFTTTDGINYELGRIVKARPFDTSGPVKWAYATGATAVQPPVVAHAGIIALSNDRTVHSLTRGTLDGGIWPTAYTPDTLTGVAHSRSPVLPLPSPVGGADALLLVGDDTGDVFGIDALKGSKVWGPVKPDSGSKITGAPGAMLAQWGGPLQSVVIVGTRDDVAAAGALHTLALETGTLIDSFDGGGTMGVVVGTPVMDYANHRVYVASFSKSGGPSLWCVHLDDAGLMTECGDPWTAPILGDIVTSPVLYKGRLYVSSNTHVYSVDAETGTEGPGLPTGDGAAKGFLWPDRLRTPPDPLHEKDLYFATNSLVRGIHDEGGTLSTEWTWDAGGSLEPNVLLQWPNTNLLYVGSRDGLLYQLDFSSANMTTPPDVQSVVLGAGLDHVGAPSLDIGVEPPDVGTDKKILLVGSESGVLYAVEVPLGP